MVLSTPRVIAEADRSNEKCPIQEEVVVVVTKIRSIHSCSLVGFDCSPVQQKHTREPANYRALKNEKQRSHSFGSESFFHLVRRNRYHSLL